MNESKAGELFGLNSHEIGWTLAQAFYFTYKEVSLTRHS